MSHKLYPLLFTPVYKDYVWGGDRMARVFGRTSTPRICAESWEIADRPEGMSVVSNGPLAGTTLHRLVESMGAALTGKAGACAVFPLLVKIIDARDRASIQVHPDSVTGPKTGGEPKTEMWHILDADPGTRMFLGLKDHVTIESSRKAVEDNGLEKIIRSIPAKKGDTFFIPGGIVHATGEGTLLLEIQQNSNTTYRIYDWGRMNHDGKPRELHVKKALEVIRWDDETILKPPARLIRKTGLNSVWEVVSCSYFQMTRLELSGPEAISRDDSTFDALFAASGSVAVESNGHRETVHYGSSCLVPAASKGCTVTPVSGKATVLRTTLG